MRFTRLLLLFVVLTGLVAAQTAPSASTTGKQAAGKTAAATATKDATPKGKLIDINSASVDELQELTGIGPALSQKIIAGRPYRAKTDLVTNKIIPQSTYEKIKGQIVARQAKK